MADSGDERDPLEQMAEDYLDRQRRGERPAISEYIARYPEQSEEIRDLFSALIMVEGLKPEADATVGHVEHDSAPRRERPLERVADYRILREVGRGGMGVVYEAEQESLGRRVALKVLAPWATPGPRQVQRFLREARSAAQLHHTHIVPIFGVGEHDGLHFYAMQFIRGLGLDLVLDQVRSLKEHPLGMRQDACARPPGEDSATIVARSLIGDTSGTASPLPRPQRPSDLGNEPRLNSLFNGTTSVPLPGEADSSTTTDPAYRYACGVARIGVQVADALQYAHEQGMLHRDIKPSNLLLDSHGTAWVTDFGLVKADDHEDLTHTGDLVGTLRYMAPERFWGRCDARSDVYSLGLTLFELLALRPAFETPDRHRLIHEITQSDPPKLRRLASNVPRDLETIVHTAMARDPAERYPTAAMLAEDLRCWLGHKPIRARTSSIGERLIKWGRRNPTLAALILVSVLALATVITTLAIGYSQVMRSYQRERRISYFQRIALVEQAWSDNDVSRAEEMLDTCPTEFRGWEWRYLKQLCHADQLTLQAHPSLQPNAIAYSPDGSWLATTSDSGSVDLRQAGTGRVVRSFGAIKGGAYALVFSHDSARLAAAAGAGTIQLWDVVTGRELLVMLPRHERAALSVAFSPDGRLIASASGDFWGTNGELKTPGELTIWDSETGRAVHSLRGHAGTVHKVAFSPDGVRLASAGSDGTSRLWDVATGVSVRILKGHSGAVTGLTFSPDGSRIATAGRDGTIRVWGVEDGERILSIREPDDRFFGVAFSPDGRHLASAGRNWVVTLWDTATGRKELTFRGHSREVVEVAFSPDGRHLASADYGGVVKVWDTKRHPEALTIDDHAGPIMAVAFSPESQRLATAGSGIQIRDVGIGQEAPHLERADGTYTSVAFSPDGRVLAAGEANTGFLALWDPATGQMIRRFQAHSDAVTAIAFSPDGRSLATGSRDRTIAVWDLATARRRMDLFEHPLAIRGVAFSPDGRFLAIACGDVSAIRTPGRVTIQDSQSGKVIHTLVGHRGGVSDLAYSPDGKRLATASWDRTVAIWDPATGRQEHSFSIRGLIVWAVAFSSDSRRLVAVDNIGRMKFWDTLTHLEVLTLRGHMDRVYDLAFSRDGRRLASVGRDGIVRIWDAPRVANR